MNVQFSDVGRRWQAGSGIEQLMDDLGHALASGGTGMRMLGGGNPAAIPQVAALWRSEFAHMLQTDPERFDRMLVNYDPCRGNSEFIAAIVDCFNQEYGWGLGPANVAVTSGGQTAFFYLFNMLAGSGPSGDRKILLPLVPEYIGYANQGLRPDLFQAVVPRVEHLDEVTIKYRVDFDALVVDDSIAAICVSRPTNPTGNVLRDDEVQRLQGLAAERGIPLIVDNAYGVPFPGIVFRDVTPPWGDNVILTYSLSKLGLPGTRTGIVIGPEEITSAISSATAVTGLANGNIGQALVTPLLLDGRLLHMCRDVVGPYYEAKSKEARALLQAYMPPGSYQVHASEGALFLWLQFPRLSITSRELYERLKARGVLVVPGEYFFFGDHPPVPHQQACLRLTYSMAADVVEDGIRTLADVVRTLE